MITDLRVRSHLLSRELKSAPLKRKTRINFAMSLEMIPGSIFSEQSNKNSSGDEIANVNFFYNIAHVEASAYAH